MTAWTAELQDKWNEALTSTTTESVCKMSREELQEHYKEWGPKTQVLVNLVVNWQNSDAGKRKLQKQKAAKPLSASTKQTKRNQQAEDILKRLLNGERVVRENSGKLYGVRNVGDCVSHLRKRGYNILNHESDGIFAYYYLRKEDIEDYRRNEGRPLVEPQGP
jgi:hypothetical protein